MQIHEPPQFTHEPFLSGSGSSQTTAIATPRRECVAERTIAHLLVAMRIDPRERDAVTFVLRMAAKYRTRVTLLHVAAPAESSSAHWLDAIDRLHDAMSSQKRHETSAILRGRAELIAFLEGEIPRELRESLDLQVECRVGDVATEIAKFADSRQVDLIVLCDRPSAWRLPLFPGLSQRIVQLSSKPIMFAHQPTH